MTKQIVVSRATLALGVGLAVAVLVIAVMATVMIVGGGEGGVPSQSGLSSATPTTTAGIPSPSFTPDSAVATEAAAPPTATSLPNAPNPATATPIVIVAQATAAPHTPTAAPPPSARLTEAQAFQAIANTKTPSGKTVGACGGFSIGARYEGNGWWATEFLRTTTQTGGRLTMRWNEETNIAQFFEIPIGC
jgi:hypothetical protein